MLPACTSLSKLQITPSASTHINGVVPSSNFAGTQLLAAVYTRSQSGIRLVAGRSNKIEQDKKSAAAVRCSAEKSVSIKDRLKSLITSEETQTITGTVRIQPEGAWDLTSHVLSELLGQKVKLHLVSVDIDPETKEGKRSYDSSLKIWVSDPKVAADDKDAYLPIEFSVPKDFGTPGAFVVESKHSNEFLLKSLTLQMPDGTEVHFSCNSWIYESKTYPGPRIFFANQVYLPSHTPAGLAKLRHDELVYLRGDGTGTRKTGERIYDYDVYNDLGDPDNDKKYARSVLGGSEELPYPRRCRTGRELTKADPASEKPDSTQYYVPRDDMFSDTKKELFTAASVRSFGHDAASLVGAILGSERKSFCSFDEVQSLYTEGISLKAEASLNPHDGTVLKFPQPPLVRASKEAWMTDEEFGRQRVAGLNPLVIERLKVFPPVSSLDPEIYGPPASSITAQHIEGNLEGLTTREALDQKRLFIIDYHDAYLPYLDKINASPSKEYASRTLLFLTKEGCLKPVAIELSLPPKKKGEQCVSRVFTPPASGKTDWLWQLAKAHVAVNDAGYHQLISHWLRTHACVEPFIIATRRQLSALHPLYLLLNPHFKDTMNINALARQSLINADTGNKQIGAIIEKSFAPEKYCMELSSVVYKSWRFDEQALPADLMKRGMAEKDESAKHGLRLTVEDYPFAVDGLDLWAAIQTWVKEYVGIYYKEDKAVQEDAELQAWWREIREVGHADHKDAEWWAELKTVAGLEEVLQTLIWVTSGHHAAVNFGQYAYAGFMPNCPTISFQLIPAEGSTEYEELLKDPELFFLKTISTQGQATLVMATVEVLSQHMAEEEFLGQRSDPKWTSDERVVAAFDKFGKAVEAAEAGMDARNQDHQRLKHRSGPANLPYTLLLPTSTEGLTLRGVPNSISI